MKKTVHVTADVKKQLAKTFNVTLAMVTYALNYDPQRGNSDLARRIRSLARQKGGYDLFTAPMSEVVHDADDTMTQYFVNGMRWVCNKETGLLVIYDRHGVPVESMDNPTMTEIGKMQERIKAL